MAEGARLLIECMGDYTGGSNPPHSVISRQTVFCIIKQSKKKYLVEGAFYVVKFISLLLDQTSQHKKNVSPKCLKQNYALLPSVPAVFTYKINKNAVGIIMNKAVAINPRMLTSMVVSEFVYGIKCELLYIV